jgi:7-keto-8-aminopelargonate synthetase-like enzyme
LAADREPTRKLQQNTRYFCRALRELGVETASQSAIIPVLVGAEERAARLTERLNADGLYVSGIRYPSVPKGRAILRCAVSSGHQESHLNFAADRIAAALRCIA